MVNQVQVSNLQQLLMIIEFDVDDYYNNETEIVFWFFLYYFKEIYQLVFSCLLWFI